MELKNNSKYVATSSKVIMTIIVFLFAVHILQAITIEFSSEIYRMLTKNRRDLAAAESEEQLSEAEKTMRRIQESGKNFLPDGTIHLTYRQGRTPGRFDEPEIMQIYDANDNLIWQGPESENPYEYLTWSDQRFRSYAIYRGHFNERQMKDLQMITPEFSRVLEIPVIAQDGTVQAWRYLPASDLFLGYRLDGSIIGFLGSTGFAHSKSEAKSFGKFKFQSYWYPAGATEPTVLWQTGRRLYEINFHKQKVLLVFESPKVNIKTVELHNCRTIDTQTQKEQKTKYRPTIRIVTEDGEHHLIIKNPEQKLTITLPADRWGEFLSITATTQGLFLRHFDSEIRPLVTDFESPKLYQQWLSENQGKPYKTWVELYKVDNQANLELLNRYEWNVPGEYLPRIQRKDLRFRLHRAATAFSAPLYDLAWFALGHEFFIKDYRERSNDFISVSIQVIPELRPANRLWCWLIVIAMAGFAFLHGRPRLTSRPKLAFWLLFIMAFNLAGLLTYLALNHTTIIKCPACNKRRGLAQVNCIRCGTELPAPKPRKLDLILNT